jgi:integrase
LPKVPETERPILTVPDARKLLDVARAGPTTGSFAHQPWLLFPIVFALGCGMRRSEIAALTWDRINLETGEVLVSESIREMSRKERLRGSTKTGKVRRVYLPGWALAELRGEATTSKEGVASVVRFRRGPVCLKPDGEPVNPNAMTEAFKHLAAAIGFAGTFHDLRHTAASWALAASASVKDVQLMLGHSKPSTTLNTYSHAMPDSASGTAAKLDAVMGG